MSDKQTDETDREGAADGAEDTASDRDAAAAREAERGAEDAPARENAPLDEELEEPLDVDMGSDTLAVTAMLGPERWVQFGFIALGFVVFFVTDKIAFEVWRRFSQPDPIITGAISAIVALLAALYAYNHPQSRKLADEVVSELAQVTWPSRDETYVSTVVVVVTSVIAAAYTGVFDALWSAVTDFVYTV